MSTTASRSRPGATVRLLTTGGTIAEGTSGPRLHRDGADLVASARMAGLDVDVEVRDLMDVPSTYIDPAAMYSIALAIKEACAGNVRGVVVTHGTATLEESAYLIDLWLDESCPIVFTGALRTPDTIGYDGARNLHDALVVAASPSAREHGVLVVLNGEIHSARYVMKFHTTALNAFRSIDGSTLGNVSGDVATFSRRLVRREHIDFVPPRARVELLKCYSGMSPNLVTAVMSQGAAGLVLEGLGSGGVPPQLMPVIKEALASSMIVVGCSRCPEGSVDLRPAPHRHVEGYVYDLRAAGVILSAEPGVKSRLKLIALLSGGATREVIASRFAQGS